MLSIITVCYNEKNLEETCQSIVNQTWQDFEWIVVDGGSNKETLDVFEKYKSRMKVFVSEKDNGIYDAMNKGIKLAKGEYLIFMNAGDGFYNNEVLENIFKDKKYDVDVFYGNLHFIDLTRSKKKIEIFPDQIDKNFLLNRCLPHQASFIKRELFDKYGLYNEDYKIVSDFEKWLCFMDNGCLFQHINIIVSNFYGGGASSRKNLLEKEKKLVLQNYFADTFVDTRTVFVKLFSIIPFLKIKNKIVKVFNFIPVMTIDNIDITRSKIKFLGVVPLFTIRNKISYKINNKE